MHKRPCLVLAAYLIWRLMGYLLGYDIGSSSVKVSLVDSQTRRAVASGHYPKTEMAISAPCAGWAEQDPEMWWQNLKTAHKSVMRVSGIAAEDVKAVGISYQMHGLVVVDKYRNVLRPAIIWCDSRAVRYGETALEGIGREKVFSGLLNSPGNFTASKLAWVKENEPGVYDRIDKIMLPGDYVAMRLTGETFTTAGGLSEGVFWDFRRNAVSPDIMEHFGFGQNLIAPLCPAFGLQGEVGAAAAAELGLRRGTPVTYRAGDQPNNAMSLNVLNPGEIASTAGTSGVVYGVSGEISYDPLSRVNTFAHVNHSPDNPRLGILLCINGTGILNSWMRRNIVPAGMSYAEMNERAMLSPVGSRGLSVIPFGNGAERIIQNREPGCSITGINFNIHGTNEILRAAQEGIVFSFCYGMEIMKALGMNIAVIRAGNANMFLSPLFRQALATTGGASIELYDTDGAAGAAKGAGVGAGIYASPPEAFGSQAKVSVTSPASQEQEPYLEAYQRWKSRLD